MLPASVEGMVGDMADPHLLVTGFGPFLDVEDNPSGILARRLHGKAGVRGVELPAAYRGSEEQLGGLLAQGQELPAGILSLGVHRGAQFRLESQSAGQGPSDKPDAWGEVWNAGPRLREETSVDLAACEAAMAAVCSEGVFISDSAGGYVCDFVCGLILRRGRELEIPALFLHVPAMDHRSVEEQEPVVLALVEELWRQVGR